MNAELVAQAAERGADGLGEGSSSRFQMLTHLGILEGVVDGAGNLIPGAHQGGEGIANVTLGRPRFVGHGLIDVAEASTQVAHLLVRTAPGSARGRSIVGVRLHLLDGTYELFRAHYGRRDTVVGKDGSDLRATVGIMDSTLGLLREPGVTHLAASFDTVIESFRNRMFAGYKTSAGMDPDLLAQFPLAERGVAALGVVVWGNIEHEADDAIGTAAVRWVDDVEQVVICTPDKDMAQLVVGDRIVTYNRREGTVMNEAGVVAKFGIHPESIPDYLGLVGDTADGIPGIPGWGAKSTSVVLARYGRIEMIPPAFADWDVPVRGGARLAESLQANLDDSYLYRDLARLRLDVPIAESLDDLEWKGIDRPALEEFCDGLGLDPDRFRV